MNPKPFMGAREGRKGDCNLKLRKKVRGQAAGMMNFPLCVFPLCVSLISHSQVPDNIFSREAAKTFHHRDTETQRQTLSSSTMNPQSFMGITSKNKKALRVAPHLRRFRAPRHSGAPGSES
jgi:hypothetical protein